MEKENTFSSSSPHGLQGPDAATVCRPRRPSQRKYASFEIWEPWLRPPLITDALLPALLAMAHAQAQRRVPFFSGGCSVDWRHGITTPALHEAPNFRAEFGNFEENEEELLKILEVRTKGAAN
ncbi:unnamed protein product [Urochloa humidicola]